MNRKGELTVNRKSILRAASALLCAQLLLAPMSGLAAETAALAASAQGQPTQIGETVPRFDEDRSCMGVTASSSWLMQAKVGGMMINLRLFRPEGESVTFQEGLSHAVLGTGYLRLTLVASEWEDDLVMQLDEHALIVLERVGVTEIVIADDNRAVRAVYDVAQLQQLRGYFGLTKGEQLCLSGENNPVTVVGEDGVRRQLTY